MNIPLKKTLSYFLIILICPAAYFISKSITEKKIIEKKLIYTSAAASEVYMVWGTTDGQLPSRYFWPPNSYIEKEVIYTKMTFGNDHFHTTLKLPYGSNIYYWMVQKKDKAGNETDIWDSGGEYKQSFFLGFYDDGIFKPGYFIFLAGFLPLVIFYYTNRKKQIIQPINLKYKIKDFIPELDAIRAIAVLLVIFHHWLPVYHFLNFLPNGPLGVNIFFVLSGFLITNILLKSKNQIQNDEIKKGTVFKNFYARRTLRIFPIYYLVLIVLWLLNDPNIKYDGAYYFSYTSNYLFYSQQFFPGHLAHLWSLAVEEQFYIFWPWLIILVNKKLLPYLISLFIIIGISSNYIFTEKGWWVELLTPACFDAFAIGGMLSYLIIYRQDIIEQIQSKFKWITIIIIMFFLLDLFKMSFIPSRTSHALLAILVIYYCLFKNNIKVISFILNNKWLIKIGKVSYGVYLYHLFVPELWGWIIAIFASWNIDLLYNKEMAEVIKPSWLFVQHFTFLMILCAVSWKLIERPINNLKRKFENKPVANQAFPI